MKRSLLLGVGVVFLMVGCAGPVTRDYPPVIERGQQQNTEHPNDLPSQEEDLPIEVVPSNVPAVVNPAVQSLTDQAREQYNAHNYQTAIATAERGLRIDRRAPELYLVLAQSYLQLAMYSQAEQFVQQGLRFALSGSSVNDSLLGVRAILQGGVF